MAKGSSENLEEFAVPDNPEEQEAPKLLQYAEACKKEGILAGVPPEEITIILETYKSGILKHLEGIRKQKKDLYDQKEWLEMQAEALAQLECAVKEDPTNQWTRYLALWEGSLKWSCPVLPRLLLQLVLPLQ